MKRMLLLIAVLSSAPIWLYAQSEGAFGLEYGIGLSRKNWYVADTFREDLFGSIDEGVLMRNANYVPSIGLSASLVYRLRGAIDFTTGLGLEVYSSRNRTRGLPLEEQANYAGSEIVLFGRFDEVRTLYKLATIPLIIGFAKPFQISRRSMLTVGLRGEFERYVRSMRTLTVLIGSEVVSSRDDWRKEGDHSDYGYSLKGMLGVERKIGDGQSSASVSVCYGHEGLGLMRESSDFRSYWRHCGLVLGLYL